MYNILILGAGGREHCIAWKISKSKLCSALYVAPGNAGTLSCATNIQIDILDFDAINAVVNKKQIDYIIVGPEEPLVEGVYDYFSDKNVKVLGPSKEASQLEGSKAFANIFMDEFNIPTAGYLTVTKDTIEEGKKFIAKQASKIVLKADGLAAGKGVLILDDKETAIIELGKMLDGKFGQASQTVVIEEFLDGIEFSVFVLTDGKQYKILPVAKDYKRIGEGNTGLNTGGMGAVSPVPFVDSLMMQKLEEQIVKPTMLGIQKRGFDYKGFIFLGLIKVGDEPFVIEYNCRLGDPETEVVIPRIKTDLVSLVESVFGGNLENHTLEIEDKTMATVMLVSGGYPEKYEKSKEIYFEKEIQNSIVFHAGTKMENDKLLTNGGRVLAVSSFGNNHLTAVNQSLENIDSIRFEKMYYRKDIGFDL